MGAKAERMNGSEPCVCHLSVPSLCSHARSPAGTIDGLRQSLSLLVDPLTIRVVLEERLGERGLPRRSRGSDGAPGAPSRASRTARSASCLRTTRRSARSTLRPCLVASFAELIGEEAPVPPELVEVQATSCVEGVHLARGPLLGRDPLRIDQATSLDPDEQGADRALRDVGETLVPQPRRDRSRAQACRTGTPGRCPPARHLSIFVTCLPTAHPSSSTEWC